jgi:STE24 endopeptidase
VSLEISGREQKCYFGNLSGYTGSRRNNQAWPRVQELVRSKYLTISGLCRIELEERGTFMFLRFRYLAALALFAALSPMVVPAQPAVQPNVDITKAPAAAQPSPNFNADAATEAYMAMIPEAAKARSDAYFEGGYWLVLWDFLYASAISLLLLQLRWSVGMRVLAERITRFKWLQSALYAIQYVLLTFVLGFPLEFYENYVREHKYGLATQSFGPWMGDESKQLLVSLVLGAVAMVVLFAIVRKLPRTWWIWGSFATLLLLVTVVMIGPVYLQPIFNKVTRLDDPKVTAPILRMAHANGIPTNDVYEIDASRQTTRMSANVSGFAKTMRITLNDNLLHRGSPEEIQAVMGHEMGHYVLNHIPKDMLFFLVLIVASFAYLRWGLAWSLQRWGDRWQIRDIGDPAVVPLVFLLIGILFFVLTPILNTHIRTTEKEADMFGLNASRQPDGFAQAAIHLSEYRKMRPTPLEEFVFFDHPSGYNRIHSAMVWKSQNLELSPSAAAQH